MNEDWDDEEAYFGSNRKHQRRERKLASAADRSKYKKTDQAKVVDQFDPIELAEKGYIRGRVTAIISQGIIVQVYDQAYTCELRGLLKKDRGLAKNLVAVGDYVWILLSSHEEALIGGVEPRQTILSRADNLSRRKEQIIATNIDQVLITTSVVNPPIKIPLVDRYIIATERGGMRPIVLVNKVDKLNEEGPNVDLERALYEECLQAYAQAGIQVLGISAETGQGFESLRELMQDRSSVFSGQSGVGKSSIINILTGLTLRTGETVARTRKGSHTTTSAQLLSLPFGGWCVDTPGIKSFGVWELTREAVEHYYNEIYEAGRRCRFGDCAHKGEVGCHVAEAVEKGEISALRYVSYLNLVQSLEDEHLRR